jgi:hypothetical protein
MYEVDILMFFKYYMVIFHTLKYFHRDNEQSGAVAMQNAWVFN